MGFTVIPTNIGGVSLNSLASPLASLLGGTPSAQNMMFPSDLGNNPAMGHAVIFQAYDYNTKLGNSVTTLGEKALGASFNGLVSGAGTAMETGASVRMWVEMLDDWRNGTSSYLGASDIMDDAYIDKCVNIAITRI